MMEQTINLYQPVQFKRNSKSRWEKGIKEISKNGVLIYDSDKNIVEKTYKIEVCWF